MSVFRDGKHLDDVFVDGSIEPWSIAIESSLARYFAKRPHTFDTSDTHHECTKFLAELVDNDGHLSVDHDTLKRHINRSLEHDKQQQTWVYNSPTGVTHSNANNRGPHPPCNHDHVHSYPCNVLKLLFHIETIMDYGSKHYIPCEILAHIYRTIRGSMDRLEKVLKQSDVYDDNQSRRMLSATIKLCEHMYETPVHYFSSEYQLVYADDVMLWVQDPHNPHITSSSPSWYSAKVAMSNVLWYNLCNFMTEEIVSHVFENTFKSSPCCFKYGNLNDIGISNVWAKRNELVRRMTVSKKRSHITTPSVDSVSDINGRHRNGSLYDIAHYTDDDTHEYRYTEKILVELIYPIVKLQGVIKMYARGNEDASDVARFHNPIGNISNRMLNWRLCSGDDNGDPDYTDMELCVDSMSETNVDSSHSYNPVYIAGGGGANVTNDKNQRRSNTRRDYVKEEINAMVQLYTSIKTSRSWMKRREDCWISIVLRNEYDSMINKEVIPNPVLRKLLITAKLDPSLVMKRSEEILSKIITSGSLRYVKSTDDTPVTNILYREDIQLIRDKLKSRLTTPLIDVQLSDNQGSEENFYAAKYSCSSGFLNRVHSGDIVHGLCSGSSGNGHMMKSTMNTQVGLSFRAESYATHRRNVSKMLRSHDFIDDDAIKYHIPTDNEGVGIDGGSKGVIMRAMNLTSVNGLLLNVPLIPCTRKVSHSRRRLRTRRMSSTIASMSNIGYGIHRKRKQTTKRKRIVIQSSDDADDRSSTSEQCASKSDTKLRYKSVDLTDRSTKKRSRDNRKRRITSSLSLSSSSTTNSNNITTVTNLRPTPAYIRQIEEPVALKRKKRRRRRRRETSTNAIGSPDECPKIKKRRIKTSNGT